MRRFALLLAALLVVPASPALAKPGSAISGFVRDLATGAGVEGICADAWEDGWVHGGGYSGPDGRYEIMGIDAGSYEIRFWDCSGEGRFAPEWYDDAAAREDATPVTVAEGQEVSGIDALLAPGGSVSGRITDENGDPIEGVCVNVTDGDGYGAAWGYSSQDGTYRAGGLGAGTYKVGFSGCGYVVVERADEQGAATMSVPPSPWPGYAAEWWNDRATYEDADPVAVAVGVDTPGIDAVLSLAGAIKGRVTDAAGRGIASICVEVETPDGSWVGSGYTDHRGRYWVGGLRAGSYLVRFTDCTGGDIWLGEWFDDAEEREDATAVTVRAGEITARVGAVLDRVPAPDLAVTGLEIENTWIETDAGRVAPTGINRRVHVELANLGDDDPGWAVLEVSVTTRTDGATRVIHHEDIALGPGEHDTRTVVWNGAGSVGDATVTARVCSDRDFNPRNDSRSKEHYVGAGGTGVGLTPAGWGARPYDWYPVCHPIAFDPPPRVPGPQR